MNQKYYRRSTGRMLLWVMNNLLIEAANNMQVLAMIVGGLFTLSIYRTVKG